MPFNAFIVRIARTAGGRRGGKLSGWHAVDLGGFVLKSIVRDTNLDPNLIDDVIMGCTGQAGEQSTNVARNCVLSAGFPESIPGVTVDRRCGSAQQAVHFASQAVMSGTMDIVIAGGVESMTHVPMGMPSALALQNGYGHYISEAIRRKYQPEGVDFSQFWGAEQIGKKYMLSKRQLDDYSLQSHKRAALATSLGLFTDEIIPVPVRPSDKNETTELHSTDEGIRANVTLEGIEAVKALQDGYILTAANSSQICDGASACVIANERGLRSLGAEPMCRIHHMSVHGHDPVIMLEAPLTATNKALQKCKMSISDIDLFEINEAFASIPLAWLKHTQADPSKVNALGGAIAMGHPLGATGTHRLATLVHALARGALRYGMLNMCQRGGSANVTIIENLRR
jgi:acetyl-CoA C-acetyltransferase